MTYNVFGGTLNLAQLSSAAACYATACSIFQYVTQQNWPYSFVS